MIVALAGGVGGARLANGLARLLPPGGLTVVVNTGDDFEHLGLTICPDIDTVTYTLAGINDPVQGWGIAGESWAAMDAIGALGGETWFRLGDRDLATHLIRTQRLAAGETLSAITGEIARRLGITQAIVPMSDDPVRSIVETDAGALPFQDYFVRRQCAPRFLGIRFDGVERARPGVGFMAALADPALAGIVICPSNPLLSLAPILAVPGVRAALMARRVPCVAVSPFIGGKAVKGPAAKIMAELALGTDPAAVAAQYDGLIDGLVVDHADAGSPVPAGVALHVTDTLMRDPVGQSRLGRETLAFVRTLHDA